MADLPFYLFTVVIYSFGYWLGVFVGRKGGVRRRSSWCGHIPPARNPSWPVPPSPPPRRPR